MKAKKLTTFLLAAAMTAAATGGITAQAADNITVTVDGQKVVFDQPPVNINNRVMVPVRAVAEKMGWEVEYYKAPSNKLVNWEFETHTYVVMHKPVIYYKANYVDGLSNVGYIVNIELEENSIIAGCDVVNNTPKPLVAKPVIINGRTLLGIRDIAEGMHADVSWDGKTKTVIIKTKPVEQFPDYEKMVKWVDDYKTITQGKTEKETETKVDEKAENQDREKKYIVDNEFFEEMIKVANAERAKVGADPLVINDTLMQVADIRAEEAAEKFEHKRLDGADFRTAFYEADGAYKQKSTSEILARANYIASADGIVDIWLKSTKGHRENLLDSKWKYVGVGSVVTKTDYDTYVMVFSN